MTGENVGQVMDSVRISDFVVERANYGPTANGFAVGVEGWRLDLTGPAPVGQVPNVTIQGGSCKNIGSSCIGSIGAANFDYGGFTVETIGTYLADPPRAVPGCTGGFNRAVLSCNNTITTRGAIRRLNPGSPPLMAINTFLNGFLQPVGPACGAGINLADNGVTNITSVGLDPGIWLVDAYVDMTGATTTTVRQMRALVAAANNSNTPINEFAFDQIQGANVALFTAGGNTRLRISFPVDIAASATYNLNTFNLFAVSTMSAAKGCIQATRLQ